MGVNPNIVLVLSRTDAVVAWWSWPCFGVSPSTINIKVGFSAAVIAVSVKH